MQGDVHEPFTLQSCSKASEGEEETHNHRLLNNNQMDKGNVNKFIFLFLPPPLSWQPFTYAICLNELGQEVVHQYIGQEPSGRYTVHTVHL